MIEASVLGGIRGDNDTFGGFGFVVENGALEGGLLWVGIDNKWFAGRWSYGALSRFIGGTYRGFIGGILVQVSVRRISVILGYRRIALGIRCIRIVDSK